MICASDRNDGTAAGRAGFTLTELVIVVAVLAILAGLAMPSYQRHLRRSHRVEAIGAMLRVAACQERMRAASGRYDTRACLPPAAISGYVLDYDSPRPGPTLAYSLRATPLAAQAADDCGTLILRHTGARGVMAAGANSEICWAGR